MAFQQKYSKHRETPLFKKEHGLYKKEVPDVRLLKTKLVRHKLLATQELIVVEKTFHPNVFALRNTKTLSAKIRNSADRLYKLNPQKYFAVPPNFLFKARVTQSFGRGPTDDPKRDKRWGTWTKNITINGVTLKGKTIDEIKEIIISELKIIDQELSSLH